MNEFIPALLVIVVGTALAGLQMSRFPSPEARLLLASFVAHLASAFIQVWIIRGVYGGGDMLGYAAMGEILAATLRADFSQFAPEIGKMLFHIPAVVPVDVPGQGTSTASMHALAGILTFLTAGSVYTLCLAFAILAYFGQVALYRAFRNAFPIAYRRRLLIAALLIPSEVFWSSALLKECIAMFGLGYLILGLERALHEVRLGALVMIGLGATIVSLFKGYILFAAAIAVAAGIYFRSGRRPVPLGKPLQLVLALAVAAGSYGALTRMLPQYSIDNFAEQAANYQGQEEVGGSAYTMGDPSRRTIGGQLAFAPFALATSLFRPVLLEAKNPLIFANALETTTALVLVWRVLRRRPLKITLALLSSNAMLMFCLVFVIVFGIGVGLTTTNLGTLSRYRMPLVPFLWALLLILDAPEKSSSAEAANRHVPALPMPVRSNALRGA